MPQDFELLVRHFETPERRRGFATSFLSAIFSKFPEFIEEVRKDSILSISHGPRLSQKNYTILKGNPGFSAGREVIVVLDETAEQPAHELLFVPISDKKPRRK